MNQKSGDKIIKIVVDAIENTLKPRINNISKELGNNSDQMGEIKLQLNRIEYKIDLLLSSQTPNRSLLLHQRKIFKS